jgi:hypothetical protein
MRADQSDFLASLFDGSSPRTSSVVARLLAQNVSMQQASLTRFAWLSSTTLNIW